MNFLILVLLSLFTMTTFELQAGDVAPNFKAEATDGSWISLSDYHGKSNVLLFFYPEDMTGGCTVEAQCFRDDQSKFKEVNTAVLGISLDPREKHQRFTEKENLNFPLLVDEGGKICAAYGVPVEENWPKRWSFLIGKDGKILKVYRQVKVREHSAEILRDIKELTAE